MKLIRFNQAGWSGVYQVQPTSGIIAGARLELATGKGSDPTPADTITQEILIQTIDIRPDNAASLKALHTNLERKLRQAEYEAGKVDGNPVYLEVQLNDDGDIWRSPVLSGRIELLGSVDQRANWGSQAVKVILTRANWWEKVTATTMFNQAAVYNHNDADAGHVNNFVSDEAAGGNLPAPATVILASSGTGTTTHLTNPAEAWEALVGQAAPIEDTTIGFPDTYLEGEEGTPGAGVTGTTVADAGCSGGNYNNLAWNGASEVRLWAGDFSVEYLYGHFFRPVLRLQAGIAAGADEKMWAHWEMYFVSGGSEYYISESAGEYLTQGDALLIGPVLRLPPWEVNTGASGITLRLALKAAAAGAGAHAVKLDYVDLCPLDGWRFFDPISTYTGITVTDRGQEGTTGFTTFWTTHNLEGPGFWIEPGKYNQFKVFIRANSSPITAPLCRSLLTVSYRERRRAL